MAQYGKNTADVAIGRADRARRRTHHAFWCRVDGGTHRHRRTRLPDGRLFTCARCEEQRDDADRVGDLLAVVDRFARVA